MAQLQRLIFLPEQFEADTVRLNAEQQKYLFRVLRLQSGDSFIAMDGRGKWWRAEIVEDRGVLREAIAINNELSAAVTIVAAPVKGPGFENVIRATTELGMCHFIPLLSERTVVKPNLNKISRWQKIAQEATEQSLRQVMPTVHGAIPLSHLEATLEDLSIATVLFCSTQSQMPSIPQIVTELKQTDSLGSMALMTGPEGGWTPQEEALFQEAGFHGVSLGSRILRAVTAPISALSILSSLFPPM